jgi:putative RecB family exonuclease
LPSYSPSALDLFEKCPLAFRYRYVDRLKDTLGETLEQYLGKTVHSTLEWIHLRAHEGAPPMWHEILEDFHERYDGGWSDSIRIVKKSRTREGYRKVGERCARNYYEVNTPFDRGSLVGIEWDFSLPLIPQGQSPTIRGRIDRVTRIAYGHLEVHDYKTGSHVPSRQDLERSRQPMLYALAVGRSYPEAAEGRIDLIWHYLQSGIRIPFSYRQDRIRRGIDETMALTAIIEGTERFDPRPSPLCPWCEYGHVCPEYGYREEVREATSTGARDAGVDLVDRLERLTALKREFEHSFRDEKTALERAIVAHGSEKGVQAVIGTRMEALISDQEKIRLRKRKL